MGAATTEQSQLSTPEEVAPLMVRQWATPSQEALPRAGAAGRGLPSLWTSGFSENPYVTPGGPGFSVSQALPGTGSLCLVSVSALCFLLGPGRLFTELTKIAITSYSCRVFDAQMLQFPPITHCLVRTSATYRRPLLTHRWGPGSLTGDAALKSALSGTWRVSSASRSAPGSVPNASPLLFHFGQGSPSPKQSAACYKQAASGRSAAAK